MNDVVVVGIGMLTAVGLTAAETATSVRSGTMRFTESNLRDKRFEPFTLALVPEDGMPPLAAPLDAEKALTGRERRMLRLATLPLRECVAPLVTLGFVPPLALCLALPETETTIPLDRPRFLRLLRAQVGGTFDAEHSDASHLGRAGGLIAVGQAVLTIQQGIADFALAGGIDSFRDPFVLGVFDGEERVKSSSNLDGFVPGEGAAFVLLASARAAAQHELAVLARLSAVALGYEPGHLYSSAAYRGEGLAATFAQLRTMGTAPVAEVYSSMNGENHWAKEWGVGFMRNRDAFLPNHRMHHPADCVGDTGAACGPLMLGLATLGLQARYRHAPTLLYASSDRGQRAAVVLGAP